MVPESAYSPIAESGILIYPNPFNEVIHVKSLKEGMHFVVADLAGRILCTGITEEHEIRIGHELSHGAYFLIIQANGRFFQKLIVKQ